MAIKCDNAFERMLEADPAELSGRSDSELAGHVRECPRCQAVATELLAGQLQLASALIELGPRTEVSEALGAAQARWQKTLRRERAWRWAPLAAAAAVAAAMVIGSLSSGRLMEGELAAAPAAVEPLVESATSQSVMVFETRDRSATVIWFY
jgi:anti-sigma-K factor RskA